MANNAFLIFLLIGAVVLGAILGYFAFLGMYQEQFAQQDRIILENFEAASVVLHGTIIEIGTEKIVLERNGMQFPLFVSDNTLFLVPDRGQKERLTTEEKAQLAEVGRPIVKEGSLQDIVIKQTAEVVAQYLSDDGTFHASRIVVSPIF